MKTINNKGFSLIEILVAMGLIGVLTAMAIPAYNNYRGNANKTVLKSDVGNAYKAYHAYNAVEGDFCASLAQAGLNSLKESSTYGTKSFIGFDRKESGECASVNDINEEDNTAPSMVRSQCTLGSSSFKFAVVNEFDGNEVGFSVANNNSSPKQGGAYCKKSSGDESAVSGFCQESSSNCAGDSSNDCNGSVAGTDGVWVSAGALCR